MAKTCKNCRHFEQYEEFLPHGTCFAGPPTPWLTSDVTNVRRWMGFWPQVTSNKTCGAWKWQGVIRAFYARAEYGIEKDKRKNAVITADLS